MRFKFYEIPPEGTSFELVDFSWFPDGEVKRRGDFSAQALLSRQELRIHVAGQFSGVVAYVCDRCLEEFLAPLESQFDVLIECDGQEVFSKEHHCSNEDLDIMRVPDPVVDLDALFRQQVYLAFPLKRLCSEMCKGLCSNCGKNLNTVMCNCPQSKETCLFHSLAKLKNS